MAQAHAAPQQFLERAVKLGSHEIEFAYKNQDIYLQSKEALAAYPQKLSDCLIDNASRFATRTFVARRDPDSGQWIHLSYAETLNRAWRVAQALYQRPLSVERPLMILSGNDLHHLILSMGAMLAGVPFSAISPAYSLLSTDFGKLKHAVHVLTPGMIYASDGQLFAPAIQACAPPDVEVLTDSGWVGDQLCSTFSSLLDNEASPALKQHYATLDAQHIAKFLFTSGSTKLPKAVPTTHLMLCANQQMLLQTFPEFALEPPVLLDWLAWHHTFGGSHNLGIVLYNAGTLYIDDGKPVVGKFEQTLLNLKEISPTVYFNVPKGWEDLTTALEQDAELRQHFFARVKLLFFAGAALSQASWDRLDQIAQQHCGERIRIMSGLGMTETAPSCLFSTGPQVMAGFIGYPAPGCQVKLSPVGDKLEFCAKGPHVMQGYWRMAPEPAAQVFDAEGYYRTGDAVRFVDPADPRQGLMFDGRIAEDFKLNTGTFVNVGSLRSKALIEGHQLIQDLCVTGSNLESIGFLIFPKIQACADLAGLDPQQHSIEQILTHDHVRHWFRQFLLEYNNSATGSSNRVSMLYLMQQAPRLDLGEITDKGNLNQNAILKHRAALVSELYQTQLDKPLIIRLPLWGTAASI
jgi:feruloyl-CoA synthase